MRKATFCVVIDGLLQGERCSLRGRTGRTGRTVKAGWKVGEFWESEKEVMKRVIIGQGRGGGWRQAAAYFLSSMRKVVPRPGSELFT